LNGRKPRPGVVKAALPRPPGMARFPIIFGRFSPVARWTVLHQGHDFAVSRRDAPEVCIGSTLENGRAQGMPGARCTRGLVRKEEWGCAHEHTGSAEASGIPCVMALRLIPCSPRRPGLFVTVAPQITPRNLTPASGRQDHTVLPYAQTSFVLRASMARRRSRVHHIPSRVRDDARPPLLPEQDARI
jgi:hypothetical protein